MRHKKIAARREEEREGLRESMICMEEEIRFQARSRPSSQRSVIIPPPPPKTYCALLGTFVHFISVAPRSSPKTNPETNSQLDTSVDYYDVSAIDGVNLPMEMKPDPGSSPQERDDDCKSRLSFCCSMFTSVILFSRISDINAPS